MKRRWHTDFVNIAHVCVAAVPRVRSLSSEEQFFALSPDVSAYIAMDEETFRRLMSSVNFGVLMELITGEGID